MDQKNYKAQGQGKLKNMHRTMVYSLKTIPMKTFVKALPQYRQSTLFSLLGACPHMHAWSSKTKN